MKTKLGLSIACVLMISSVVAAAGGVKLANEKQIMTIPTSGDGRVLVTPGSMRLSPDGKGLLFIRREKIKIEGGKKTRTGYRLVLRDLATGTDKVLPIPALFDDDYATMYVALNPFDKTGAKIVVPTGDDANGDGLIDPKSEKMYVGIYDVATGKVRKLDMTDSIVFPGFDATGTKIVALLMSRDGGDMKGQLVVTPVDKPKLRVLSTWGLPHPMGPKSNLLPLMLPPDRTTTAASRPSAPEPRFVLLDIQTDKIVTDLPVHKRNSKLDDVVSQWTTDGRYLYYIDAKIEGDGDGGRRRYAAHIYDVKKRADAGFVDGMIAIGPGPGPTTMVMAGRDSAPSVGLHDAATGATQLIMGTGAIRPEEARAPGPLLRPICAAGKVLIFARGARGGPAAIYQAEMVPAGK